MDGDEAQIRALYRRMLDCWLDAPPTPSASLPMRTYITGGGKLERGWRENVEGHQITFSAWARDSRLAWPHRKHPLPDRKRRRPHRLRSHRVPDRADTGKRSIYTATAQELDGHWIFVGYQNTPLVA